jgi:hypothetical protein
LVGLEFDLVPNVTCGGIAMADGAHPGECSPHPETRAPAGTDSILLAVFLFCLLAELTFPLLCLSCL